MTEEKNKVTKILYIKENCLILQNLPVSEQKEMTSGKNCWRRYCTDTTNSVSSKFSTFYTLKIILPLKELKNVSYLEVIFI